MKTLLFYIVLVIFGLLAGCDLATAQNVNAIKARCPNPNSSMYAFVLVQLDGNINAAPCPTKSFQINGITVPSGTGTTNTLPLWTASGTLGNSRISQTATQTIVNANNVSNGEFKVNAGSQITLDSKAGLTSLGDINVVGHGIVFTANDTTKAYIFAADNQDAQFGLTEVLNFQLQRTLSVGTGSVTINKPAGTVNFAAGAAAITVTNSSTTSSSIIFAMARTNDTTCSVKNVVPSAGSFVINMTTACTATTSVGFFETN